MKMCNFAKEDVLIVARAIAYDPLRYMDGDHIPFFICIYCDAELHGYSAHEQDFKHDLNCPVLVAMDLLTGIEESLEVTE